LADDIPQIVSLYQEVFREGTPSRAGRIESVFEEVYFRGPWRDEDLPSLVYLDEQGRIEGFLGVFPRIMTMRGEKLRVAVSNNFMVRPGGHSPMAALELLRTYLAGPQDLSVAESSEKICKLWRLVGGSVMPHYSLEWLRPLGPCQFLTSKINGSRTLSTLAPLTRPLSSFADGLILRTAFGEFRRHVRDLTGEECDTRTHLQALRDISRNYALFPEYDEQSLGWMWQLLCGQQAHYGRLRRMAVKNGKGELIGWHVYHVNPGGVGEVLQIGARANDAVLVFQHLLDDAARQGVAALSGRVPPELLSALTDKFCVLRNHASFWMLVHSRMPKLLDHLYRGEAFLSRFEGEWMFYHLTE
jgi:hypothetical protein